MSLLRSATRRGLAGLGLASSGRLAELEQRATDLQRRADEHRRALDEARAAAEQWKARAKELEQQAKHAATLAERLEKTERELQQWKARDEKHLGQLKEVRERMERAERAISLSREHLMATEAKLDIVEGAIGALDARTRAVLRADHDDAGN